MRENGLNLEVSMATVALTKKIQQNKKLWTERTVSESPVGCIHLESCLFQAAG